MSVVETDIHIVFPGTYETNNLTYVQGRDGAWPAVDLTSLELEVLSVEPSKHTVPPCPSAIGTATAKSVATPWTLSPQEAAAIDDNANSVIDIARTRMAALRTAHFSIEDQGLKLEFDVRFPYEVRGVMTGSGEPEEVGLLLTKGKGFTGDPDGSCWSERSAPFGIVAVFGGSVVMPILWAQLDLADSLRNLEQAPDETADALYHFRFDIDQGLWLTHWVQVLAQAIGEQTVNAMYPPESREALSRGDPGIFFKGEAWIDKESLLVHRFLWKQFSTKTGLPSTSTVTVSHFDQAVPEVPEVEAIMAVGPCGPTPTPAPETASITLDLDNAEISGLEVIRIRYDAYSPEGAVITFVSRSGDQELLLSADVRREGPFSVSGTHDWPVTNPRIYQITSSVYDWPTFEASLGKDYLEANPTLFTHGVPPQDLLERILASGIRPVASASSSILVLATPTPTATPTTAPAPAIRPAATSTPQSLTFQPTRLPAIRLVVFTPEVSGLDAIINGVVTSPGAVITKINWDWGDGSSNDSWFPAEHTYDAPGSYEVRVTAFDDSGRSKSVNVNVAVSSAPTPETVRPAAPTPTPRPEAPTPTPTPTPVVRKALPPSFQPLPGLVSWWPGDGHADDVAGGNHGTLLNGATFAPGVVGQAFSFDGVDGYVEIGDIADFETAF